MRDVIEKERLFIFEEHEISKKRKEGLEKRMRR